MRRRGSGLRLPASRLPEARLICCLLFFGVFPNFFHVQLFLTPMIPNHDSIYRILIPKHFSLSSLTVHSELRV